MMNRRRRSLISSWSALPVLLLIGCTGTDSENEDVNESILSRIALGNHIEESVRIDVLVDWEGEQVHESSHELDGLESNGIDRAQGTIIERDWPDEPASWEVSARVNGGEWSSMTPSDVGSDCAKLTGTIETFDRSGVTWSFVVGAEC